MQSKCTEAPIDKRKLRATIAQFDMTRAPGSLSYGTAISNGHGAHCQHGLNVHTVHTYRAVGSSTWLWLA